nr:hypothetical protein [Tanacetum cinerariifolium]
MDDTGGENVDRGFFGCENDAGDNLLRNVTTRMNKVTGKGDTCLEATNDYVGEDHLRGVSVRKKKVTYDNQIRMPPRVLDYPNLDPLRHHGHV